MNVPALEGCAEFEWALFYDESGYYQAANKFGTFLEEIEESEVDLTEDNTPDDFRENLSPEQIAGLVAFSNLSVKMLDQWSTADLENLIYEASLETSLEDYLDEEE